MPKKTLYFDAETQDRIDALAPSFQGNESEVVRVAVEQLHRYHFHPESIAPDAVLEQARRHLGMALAVLEGEIARRVELADRLDDE